VVPGSILSADDWGGYRTLSDEYKHRTIRHRDRIYVDGLTHTQTVEGFFGSSKNAIRGVYHGVSGTHLQGYLNEFAWRYNNRGNRNAMFRRPLGRSRHDWGTLRAREDRLEYALESSRCEVRRPSSNGGRLLQRLPDVRADEHPRTRYGDRNGRDVRGRSRR